MKPMLENGALAGLLAFEAEKASYPLQKAIRRAARVAFIWPIEAAELIAQGRSLTELPGIGPPLEKLIHAWLIRPPKLPQLIGFQS